MLGVSGVGHAQQFDPLIRKAWDNNHQLKAKEFELTQAQAALTEAKAMFRPSITFGTQYTLAAGGRSMDFPIGDLLNPVHSQLNELTASQKFPTLQNQTILFLPNNFYDARFRLQQPIFYPDLAINRTAKFKQEALKVLEVKAYKRLLIKELQEGYFQWKQATEALGVYESANNLLEEAGRSTESMIRNNMALPSARSRIEGEKAVVASQVIEAKASEENAWRYLEFLLGKNETNRDELIIDLPELPLLDLAGDAGTLEDLQQMDLGVQLQELAVERERQFFKPHLGAQVDLGSQDFDFGLAPYAILGINLEWNLFDGKRNQMRRQQASAGLEVQREQRHHVEEHLTLQREIAQENLEASISQAMTFELRIDAAQSIYRDVLKRYQAGSANYLELLDARTQITQSEISYLISRYQAWNRWAQYHYVNALYPID
ncbi:MAG: TolC family protein [Saprospiraceae bacterium]|nr:TolC family protein [Saprospiraceae bacterium]